MKKMIGFILLAVLAWSSLAQAGERAGAYSISPYVGGYSFDDAQSNLRQNRMVYGIRLGYDWTDSLATELVGNYIRSESMPSKADNSIWNYRLDMLYNFMPSSAMVPYLAGGVGGIQFEYPKSQSGDLAEFTANVGGGVKFFMTESVALRADGRYIWDFSNDNWRHKAYNNIEYSLGVSFLFGGTKTAAAAARREPAPRPVERAVEPPPAKQAAPPAEEPPLGPVPAAEPTPGHYKYLSLIHISEPTRPY
jgi:OOP family OmpA-OmpF porin